MAALQIESRRRHREFAEGISRYWSRPRSNSSNRSEDLDQSDIFWSDGTTRLLDFGSPETSDHTKPVLIIPSLINRYHVLDLSGGRSFVRALAAQGFHPYIVDWGTPGGQETNFDLSAYVTKRLEPIAELIADHHKSRVNTIGYCMGGLLALALATRKPETIGSLALLATPWDFHSNNKAQAIMLKIIQPQINSMIDTLGVVPHDVLQAMFTSLSPWLTIEKFRRFSQPGKNQNKDDLFVELEDWIGNGTPLAGPVARECLNGWYINNAPLNGQWCIDDTPVLPEQVQCPSLVVIPKHDHIVPPGSAAALGDKLPGPHILHVKSGHIGMVAGTNAHETLLTPLVSWLKDLK